MSKSDDLTEKKVVITGGAGFIGTNLAHRLLSDGYKVTIYDNLSRSGSERNLYWLKHHYTDKLQVYLADIRDANILKYVLEGATQVYHLAAQVAVTKSMLDPVEDFEINLRGTLNLLEILRSQSSPPSLLYTSTNKVFGELPEITLNSVSNRYEPVDKKEIGEKHSLDFYSPYGCSKGGADQYVLDYARCFGIKATVFRMSCIYGAHQFGTEDQGWVAHFLIAALKKKTITIFGDGLQVRDVLYVDDLIGAMIKAQKKISITSGKAFTIGGGIKNTLSLKELVCIAEKLQREKIKVNFAPWRTGDQKYYVSDISRFSSLVGWNPKVEVKTGIKKLFTWLKQYDIAENIRLEKEKVT